MSIKFKSAEMYYGIRVYISENSDKDFYLTKSLINNLKNVEIKFRQNRINTPVADLFKHLVIIKGSKERSSIDKIHKSGAANWRAFFNPDTETIAFDLQHFKNEEALINTLVHEIGHAIHVKFVTPDASKYISVVGKQYVNVIVSLKDLKSIVEQNVHDDDLCMRLIKKAEDVFYDFADLLDNSINSSDYDENHKTSNISFQICEEYELYLKEKGIKTYVSKIEKMISVIMKFIPSEYGATEEKEFFAECFRQFILSPDDLSLNNRNMIINALTYSRAQGKELMQAHKLLKNYVRYIID
jgi:hypothetical protein